MRQMPEGLAKLERALGYDFCDKRLLQEALTHSTFAYEHRHEGLVSNERLEYLGDAVLDLVIGDYLFRQPSHFSEGHMSKTRALIVCESTLTVLARQLGLGELLLMGKGETATGGSSKPSNLSNAVEAIFGAIYLDSGYIQAQSAILRLLAGSIIEALAGMIVFDYKSRLLEYVQSLSNVEPLRFVIISETGPVHERIFTAAVFQGESLISQGTGNSKKEAEQQAARLALDIFLNNPI